MCHLGIYLSSSNIVSHRKFHSSTPELFLRASNRLDSFEGLPFSYFWIAFVVGLLRANPFSDELIANGVRESEIVVARRRDVSILDERVVQVPIEAFRHGGDALEHGNVSHRDLLAFEAVRADEKARADLAIGRFQRLSHRARARECENTRRLRSGYD